MGGMYISAFPSPPAIASSTSLEDDLLILCLPGERNPELMLGVLLGVLVGVLLLFGMVHPPNQVMVSSLSGVEELSLKALKKC